MRTAAIVAFVAIFVTCTARGAVPAGDHPDLRRDGNIVTTAIATENGTRMLGVNAGFLDGANETKLFGRNRPTTLWSDKRRTECYEFSLRIACQMPLLTGVMTDVDAQEILQEMGFIAGEGSAVAGALDALKYNYVSSSTWAGRASNEISTWMRKINPRTVRGLKITPRNLVHISEALATVEGVAMAADFALGAAIQEALAGDLALARLDLIEQIIDRRRRAGAEVDPAIRPALARVRENLDRSKDYFGALITELNDRKGDVTKIGISAILEVTKADAVRLLTKYYVHHAVKAAATKAATVAGLWTWSLMLTYETIATILEQHQQAQIAVTSTSLALLLEEEITKGRLAEDETVCGLQRQLEYSYYDQMVDACSGIAQLWYDLVTSGFSRGPYAEARDEFTRLRGLTRDALLACTPPGSGSSDANPQTGPITLGLILDSSGSMQINDPGDSRKVAASTIIERLTGNEGVFVVDFDDRSRWLNSGNWENWDRASLKNAVASINSDGGTNVGGGLQEMRTAMEGIIAEGDRTGILLLSDGLGDYAGQAQWFADRHIPIHTISFVGEDNARLLQDIANLTGGEYMKANSAMDIVQAFTIFFTRLTGQNLFCRYEGSIKQGQRLQRDLWIEPGTSSAMMLLSWPGSTIGLTLQSPDGRILSNGNGAGEWITGDRYVMVRLDKPAAGKWRATLEGVQVSLGGEPFSFEVNGDSPHAVRLRDLTAERGVPTFTIDFGSWPGIAQPAPPKVTLTTPRSIVTDISPQFKNGEIVFIPSDGKGSYRVDIALRGNDARGLTYERVLTKSILISDDVPVNAAVISEVFGRYVRAPAGTLRGNRPGVRCQITGAGADTAGVHAVGHVINVKANECTVEILKVYSTRLPRSGDVVILNIEDWSADKVSPAQR